MKRVFAHIGFSMAVTLLAVQLLPDRLWVGITAGLAVLFAVSLCLKKYRQAVTVPLCFGSALFACLLLIFSVSAIAHPQLALDGERCETSFYLLDSGTQDDYGNYVYDAKTTSIKADGAQQNIKISVSLPAEANVDCYEIVTAELKFSSVANNAVNSYGRWGNNVFLTASATRIEPVGKSVFSAAKPILALRKSIVSSLMSLMPGDNGALSVAMITGIKDYLSEYANSCFRAVGASHIMAVSGLHLTAVTGIVLFLIKKFRIKDRAGGIILIVSVLVYIVLAGFSKSVVRAGIMMIILTSAKFFMRRGDSLNSLGLAVALICLNPFAVFDVGAVLSVLAVLSLITLYPVFSRSFKKNSLTDTDCFPVREYAKNTVLGIVSGIFVSLSVMVYTVPAMLVFFGYVSVGSVVSNIFVVPLSGVLMPLALLTYIVGLTKISFIILPFSKLTDFVAGITLKIVENFASFGGTTAFSKYFGIIISAVLVVVAFAFLLRNKRLIRLTAALSCAVVLVTVVVADTAFSPQATLYFSSGGAVAVCDSDSTVVTNVHSSVDCYEMTDFLMTRGRKISFLLCDSDNYYAVKLTQNIHTDVIVTDEFDDNIMTNAHYNSLQIKNTFTAKVSDDVSFSYDGTDSEFSVCGLTVSVGSTFDDDINLLRNKRIIRDRHGTVYLSDGSVVYDIKNKDTFGVRRQNIWQE